MSPRSTPPHAVVPSEIPAHITEQVEYRDGTRAIEVAALFEDTVLAIHHFDNPATGTVSSLTKALLAAAVASLAVMFMLFATSYMQVDKDKTASPHSDLAARSGEWARDCGAVILFGLGSTALLCGLWRRHHESKENAFSIGIDPRATFTARVDGLPRERFPLVRSTGTDYELLFTEAMSGEVTLDGKTRSLGDWATAGLTRPCTTVSGALASAIPPGARFCLKYGNSTWLVSSVARPRQNLAPRRLNWQQQSYIAAVLAGVGLVAGLMSWVPAEPRSLALDMDALRREPLIRMMVPPKVAQEEVQVCTLSRKMLPGARHSKRQSGLRCRQAPQPVGNLSNDILLPEEVFPAEIYGIYGSQRPLLEVRGSLGPQVVGRIIASHLSAMKLCYERELIHNPQLEGRFQIFFVIGTAGKVMTSSVEFSTLDSPSVESCFAAAVRRLGFPKPPSGIVTVCYPVVLRPGGAIF